MAVLCSAESQRILQGMLSGNGNFSLISHVSPGEANLGQTLQTLRFTKTAGRMQRRVCPHSLALLLVLEQINDALADRCCKRCKCQLGCTLVANPSLLFSGQNTT